MFAGARVGRLFVAALLLALTAPFAPGVAAAQSIPAPVITKVEPRNGHVFLWWTQANTGAVKSWVIERKEGSGEFTFSIHQANFPNVSPKRIDRLKNGTTYRFRIRAAGHSSGVFSPWSESSDPVTPAPPPAKPTGFKAIPGKAQIVLEWDKPSDPTITKWQGLFDLATGKAIAPWKDLTPVSMGTKLRHTVTGLTNGKEYEFQIRAATAYVSVTGGLSAVIKATPRAGTGKTLTLSVANTSITEGDSGKTDVTITATLSEGAPKGFGVSFAPDSGSTERSVSVPTLLSNTCASSTTRANFDYCIAHDLPRVLVAEGARTTRFTIGIVGDRRDENDETFGINVFPFTGDVTERAEWDGSSISLTIADDDSTPVLTAIEDASWRLGETVEITAVATDADTEDTISYSWSRVSGATLPADAVLDAARLRFTPTATGTYTMRVTASDGVNEDTEDVTITVVDKASVSVPATATVAEGGGNATVRITTAAEFREAVVFNVTYADGTATGAAAPADGDYDNDAVTSVTFPAGETTKDIAIPITDDSLDESDKTFTVTIAPAASLPAGWELGTATTTVTITDDDSSPELAAIDDVTFRIGQQVNVLASATDADNDPISYVWTRKAGETTPALPPGTALNQARLRFVPRALGTYTMTVRTSDGNGNSDTEEVTITVESGATVSVPATLTVAEDGGNATVRITTTVAFGQAVSFNVTYGDGTATGASDPANGDYDNDAAPSVQFTARGTTADIVIPITDDSLDEGDETFTVTIAPVGSLLAGWKLGTAKTTVTITDDDSSPELTAINDVTLKVGQQVDITAAATDADGDTVSYAWSRKAGETTPALPDGTSLSGDQLRFTPTATGTYTMTVTASDGNGNSDTEEVVITVGAAATISIPAKLTVAESAGRPSIRITSSEALPQRVSYTVTYADGTAIESRRRRPGDYQKDALMGNVDPRSSTGFLYFRINNDKLDEPDETFTISISISGSLPAGWTMGNATTTVTITDDDASPVLTAIEDRTIRVGQAVDITAAATDADTGDTVSYAWTRKAGETTPAIPSSTAVNAARLQFTPTATGTYTMTVTASDGNGNSDTEEVVITVVDKATVSVPATLSVTEGTDANATLRISTTATFGEAVTFDVAYANVTTAAGDYDEVASVTFGASDPTKDIDIPITDDERDESDETFTVTISSDSLPAGWELGNAKTTVTIEDDDASPVLASIDDVTIRLGQSVDITARATDADTANLTYAWTRKAGETTPAIPQGTAVNAARLQFTPPAAGTYTMTVTASDGVNEDTWDVTITVTAAATVSVPSTATVAENGGNATVRITTTAAFEAATTFNITYGGTATGAATPANGDYDNDAATSVTFMTNETTKDIAIPITDDEEDEANETITVTIAAAAALPAGWNLGNARTTVTITDDDASPVLASIDDVTIRLGQSVGITASATDADTTNLTYAWTRKAGETTPAIPQGTAVNAARLQFTPPAAGTYTMTVTASDGVNEDTWDVTITVADTATVSVPTARTVAEGAGSVTVPVKVSEAFDQAVTFNVTYGDGTATGASDPADGDFDNDAVQSVAFTTSGTRKNISIPITSDKFDETNETFTVTIAPAAALPTGWALGNATTTVTITDDDASPVLAAIDDVTLKVGQQVDITAMATDADGDTISYVWTRKTGETTPALPPGTQTGQARLQFTPTAAGTYTMTVRASDDHNSDTEEVTITVEAAATVSVPATATVAEDGGNATVRITTTAQFGQATIFNITYGGAATGAATPADGDYDNDAVTSVTFGMNDTTKDIAIPITDDDLDESNETFTVTIAPAAALPAGWTLGNAKTTVTITDDDSSPVLTTLPNVTLKLGQDVDMRATATDADGDTITYAWTRKTGETSPAIPSGTNLNRRRLRFTPPGTGTYTMTVTASDGVNSDTWDVTITVEAAATVSVPATLEVDEDVGNATVRITTTESFGEARTFNITYGGTSATGAANPANGDYDNDAVTSVQFGANDTVKDVAIPITDDEEDEGAETFTVTIAPAAPLLAGWSLGTATTTVTITDDDDTPELATLADVTIRQGQDVSITASATDDDTATLAYTWTRKAGETSPAIPQGTALNQARIQFTPPATGTYTMTVTASDGVNSDTEDVTITVGTASTVSVPSTLTVAESAGNATVPVTVSEAFGEAVTLNVTYGGASATGAANPANGDYDNDAVTTVQFSATRTTRNITIPITNDKLDESDETFTVTIAAANPLPTGWTLGTATTTVTITDDDSSPVLAAIDDVTLKVGQKLDITASATDADDGDTVTYAWTRKTGETTPAIPPGTNRNVPRLQFTPTAGTYTMTVTASDGNGNSDTEDVVITVGASATVSVPATLTVAEGVGNATVRITTTEEFGQAVTFNVTYGGSSATGAATPADGDYDNDAATSVAFTATDTTKDIAIPITDDALDESNETFTVTIAAAALPEGWVLGTATTTVTITDDDSSPVLTAINDETLKLGQEVDITASATDADTGDTISYSWARKSGDAIPQGTTLNQARLRFTPTATGTWTLTVTASDGTNSDTEDVTITVGTASTVSVPGTLTVAESVGNATVRITTTEAFGQAVSFNVTYGGSSATGAATPANGDYDNDAVTSVAFTATDTTKDIAIPITDDSLDESDETFTVTIAPASELPDGWTLGTAKTTVTITDNDSSPVLAAIDDVTLKVGQAVNILAAATDADTGDTISYAWTRKAGETTPAIPGGTAVNAARLQFTPPATGTYTMTVTASDGTNTDTEEVVITVGTAATVSVPQTLSVAEGAGNATVRITTSEAFGEAVTFNVTYGGTATGAAAPADGDYDNDAATSVAFGATDTTKDIVIPITNDSLDESDETITVTIAASGTLPNGWTLSRATSTVTITDDDSSPELTAIDDVTLKLGQGVDITAAATDADASDTITYAWTRASSETTPAIPGGTAVNAARLQFTPPGTGTYTMTVTASDGTNTDTEDVTITVTEAATVSVPQTLAVTEGTDANATVTITASEAFGQAVTFNVTYGGTATGASTPANGDYDNDAVTSVAFGATDTTKDIAIPLTDDELAESDETITVTIAASGTLPAGWTLSRAMTTVTITDDDDAPELSAIADETLKLGQAVDITAVATDDDTDTLTYTWTRKAGETSPAIPQGTAQNAARLQFTPPAVGTYTMTVTASDGVNSDTEDVTITVGTSSTVSIPATLQVTEGTDANATVTITTTEAFGEAVTLNVTYAGTATGAANPANGDYDNDAVTSVQFGASDTTKDIAIPLTDDDLDEAAETIEVTIAAATSLPDGWVLGRATTTVTITDDDASPELAAIDDVGLRLGRGVDITASATDADNDSITYAWTRKTGETTPAIPSGTRLNRARLRFTPPATGTYTMTVTARDGNGNSDTEDVTITVGTKAPVSIPATLSVAESAGNATVRVTTSEAFGQAVTLNVTYAGTATGAANPANGDYDNDAATSVAFGASDLTKDIVIPITDDDTPESAETIEVRIAGTLPAGFEFGNALTTVTITDDDSIETAAPTGGGGGGGGGSGGDDDDDDEGGTVIASPSSLDVPEGGQGTYTVVLDAAPTGQVTVRVAGASGAVTVDIAALTFTPETWNVPQAVTVRAAEDDDARPEPVVTLTHSASGGGYDEDSAAPVSVRVIEDDQVRINVTPADLEVDEGGASAYTVALDSAPSGAVTVAVTGASGDVTVDAASLTFAPSNWRDPQTVRVSAGEDDDAAPDTAVLRHRASGGGYDAAPEAQVAVSVIENDEVGVTVTPTELTVDEGSAGSYTVALESEPLAPVTVTPSSSAATAATVSGALVFTAADWATPQTVTVTGVEDEDSLEDTSATVLHAVSGGDYDGVAADSVAVTVRNTTSSKEMERANRAQEVLLPQTTAVFLAQSLGAVGERIEGRAPGGGGGSAGVRMGLMPIAPDGFGTQFGQYGRGPRALFGIPDAPGMSQQGTRSEIGGQRLPTPFEMLNGAAFNVMVGQDEEEAASGGPGIGLWGGGRLLTLSGVDQEVSWDGGLWSAHLGADIQLGRNVLAGVAVSYGESDFDAMSMDEEEGREIPLSHRTRLTVAQPYLAWMTSGGSYGWVSGSYGRGEARVQEEGAKLRRAGMNYAGVAAGGRGVLFANSGMLSSGGVTRLAVKTEGASARIHTEATDGLAEQDARVHRVRLLLEGSHEHGFGSGSLTPAVEVGVRHDAGDAAQGAGVEVGGSLRYRSFSSGLTVELRTRGLVTHAEAERREWGFGGLVILTPGQDGRGPFLMLAPSKGEVETRSGQLFDRMPGQSSAGIFGGADTLRGVRRFEAEGGHGFGLGAGALAPYAGVSTAEAGQDWRMGLRYQLGEGVRLGLEGARQDGTLGAAGKSLRLEGSLTW